MSWLTFRFGISYTGIVFLALLLIPNFIWAMNRPQGYDADGESRLLLGLERIGEALVTCLLLISDALNPSDCWSAWTFWLVLSGALMALYEGFWLRYFRGRHTMEDFYGSFCGVPVAGATLPVLAVACLGLYGRSIWLLLADVVLGIGHIGIHLEHRNALKTRKNAENNT